MGDMNPASMPDPRAAPRDSRNFHHKPVWQRFLIVLAGPMANFLLAILIFAAFFATFGIPRSPPVVGQVQPGSAAEQVGIQPGDRIGSIAGREIASFEDIRRFVALRPGETVRIIVDRDGQILRFDTPLQAHEEQDQFGQTFRVGLLGVMSTDRVLERPPPLQLIPAAADYTVKLTRSMVEGLGQIIIGQRSTKDLGGPLKIAQIAGQQASLGFFEFVQLVALFSINLGFINLLPGPMLDGGHLVFYTAEAIRRRPVSLRAQEWAFRGGLALLLALLVFVTLNDLGSFGLWDRLGRLIG
jgi:regulator of sigma E protease